VALPTPSSRRPGKNVGKSLCEDDLVPTAQMLIEKMKKRGANIPIAHRRGDAARNSMKTSRLC
jgi:3-phosphoglycerate kinase